MKIIGGILFIVCYGIITFLIHPIAFLLFTVLPIVGVLYNRKDL